MLQVGHARRQSENLLEQDVQERTEQVTREEQQQAMAMKLWLLYMLFEDEAVVREYRETFVEAVKTLPRGDKADVTMERVNTMLDKLAAKFLTPHHVEVITKKVAEVTGAAG